MKTETSFVFYLFVLLLFSGLNLASDNPPTITNEETPKGPRYTLKIEEDLRMGPEEGDAFYWTQMATTLHVDDRGAMYISDNAANRIVVLDPKGGFVRYLGAPGKGPGEFQKLVSFQILSDGRGVAFDKGGGTGFLNWFDRDLRFVKQTQLGIENNMRIQNATISPDGQRVFAQVLSLDRAARTMATRWVMMDLDGRPQITIASFENPSPESRRQIAENFPEFIAQRFKFAGQGLVGFAAFDRNNNVYTAMARNYQITLWGPQLRKQRIITRKYKPIPQTKEEIHAMVAPFWESARSKTPPQMARLFSERNKQKAIELAQFPVVKNPIGGLTVMDQGTLCVTNDINLVAQKLTVDLFDTQGRYLGDASLPLSGVDSVALVFKKGNLYRLEANEEEDLELVRYSYQLVLTH